MTYEIHPSTVVGRVWLQLVCFVDEVIQPNLTCFVDTKKNTHFPVLLVLQKLELSLTALLPALISTNICSEPESLRTPAKT